MLVNSLPLPLATDGQGLTLDLELPFATPLNETLAGTNNRSTNGRNRGPPQRDDEGFAVSEVANDFTASSVALPASEHIGMSTSLATLRSNRTTSGNPAVVPHRVWAPNNDYHTVVRNILWCIRTAVESYNSFRLIAKRSQQVFCL